MLLKALRTVMLMVAALLASDAAASDLKQILETQRAAWNRGDLNTFMQTYWKSPDLTFFSTKQVSLGWDAAIERYRKTYGTDTSSMGQLSFTDEKIDPMGPDAGVVTARWHLIMPDGKKLDGLTTIICRKIKGQWRIVHDHSS